MGCVVRTCMGVPPDACAVGEWKANSKSIDVLPSQDCGERHRVMVNEGEHRAGGKVCQSSILGMKREQKISS